MTSTGTITYLQKHNFLVNTNALHPALKTKKVAVRSLSKCTGIWENPQQKQHEWEGIINLYILHTSNTWQGERTCLMSGPNAADTIYVFIFLFQQQRNIPRTWLKMFIKSAKRNKKWANVWSFPNRNIHQSCSFNSNVDSLVHHELHI